MGKTAEIILHQDYMPLFQMLSPEQLEELVTALFKYQGGEDVEDLSQAVGIVFHVITERAAREKESYEKISATRSSNRKGKQEQTETNDNKTEQTPTNDNKPEQNGTNGDKPNPSPKPSPKPKPILPAEVERESPERKAPYGGHTPFVPPTLEEVKAYAKEIGATKASPEKFMAHYEGNGWMMGIVPMKDWKGSFRYWESTEKPAQSQKPNKFHNYDERPKEKSPAQDDLVTYINNAETAADLAGGTADEIREAGEKARREWYAKFMGMEGSEP